MLASAAAAEDIPVVKNVIANWQDSSQRFDQPGELLLIASADVGENATSTPIGIGGLSQCPHIPGAFRVRRFYIHPAWRRLGVARAIAKRTIDHGSTHADMLTCNARASSAAAPFWESMGFLSSKRPGITHTLRR